MPHRLSRRELLAWLAAGTGAATTGAMVLGGRGNQGGDDPGDRSSPGGGMPGGGMPPGDMVELGAGPPPTPTDRPLGPVGARLLVVVEMPGGNDGLSTAVPYGDGHYYDARPSIAIDPGEVLPLDGTIGLHPRLTGLHRQGVTLVHGVGSVTPDGSHFEMLNRWWSGDSTWGASPTGWIGRLADVLRDGASDPQAVALSIGSGDHPIIRSATGSTLSLPGLDALWAVVRADADDRTLGAYQAALRSFAAPGDDGTGRYRAAVAATLAFADRVLADRADDGDDGDGGEALGYSGSDLGRGLWLAATLFAAEAGIRVVHVPMDGDFDTHEGHSWRHPELMADLDANVAAFRADLDRRGLADRVLVATTSEFGRTLHENGSDGLDHGTASTMLVCGPVTAGQVGDLPSLTRLDGNGDLLAGVPLEAYLAGVVEGWLGVPAGEVFPGTDPLPIIG